MRLQLISRGRRRHFILLRHSKSRPPHDCGVSEAAGKRERRLLLVVRPVKCLCASLVFCRSSSPLSPSQMFAEYGFHPRVQCWVIGQCLCSEQRSLLSYGVCRDGDTAFLYLLSARHARLSRLQCQQDQESALLTPAPKPPPTPAPASSHDWRGYSTLPPRLHHSNTGAALVSIISLQIFYSSSSVSLHQHHGPCAVPNVETHNILCGLL